MNVSSGLSFMPFTATNLVYDGIKAFVHIFAMNMHTQLEKIIPDT